MMERSVNRVELVGNVGVEPRITTFDGGRQVLRLSVATDENVKDKNGEWRNEATWHTVVAWSHGDLPDFASFKKGQRVQVLGRIKNRSYEGKDGQTKYSYEILASSLKIDGPDAENKDNLKN